MQNSILRLYLFYGDTPNNCRTTFKTQHGRPIYLSLEIPGTRCTINDCFYLDRPHGGEGAIANSKPHKLVTRDFDINHIMTVFERELDKKFYGVEFSADSTVELSTFDYLQCQEPLPLTEYRLLIMEGCGDAVNGLPSKLITRLKNKLHRSVYIELDHYRNGQGVVKQCCYYDRKYIRQNITITPPSLVSVFFSYTRNGILDLINREICCNFTHIITIDGSEGIDLVSDTAPICGSI